MPRIKLKPHHRYQFQTELSVRITDLNYGGHLGNDRLLSLIHEARISFLSNYGFSEMDCGGVALIMADTAIVYKNEAYAGDILLFEIAAGDPSPKGFRIFYKVTRQKDNDLIALVENGMVCFDYKSKTLQPLPDAVRAICIDTL